MKQYLEILTNVFHNGKQKHPSRQESGLTKNSTIGLANIHFSHDLNDGFPLITTRKVAWKGLVGELRCFLEGKTSNSDFVSEGCHFWTPWAKDGELGPIYGAQWNSHGQLIHVLGCLKNRPTDRRMVVSAWRPDEHDKMVLPPCHLMWVVTPYDNKLNLSWIQRSCDLYYGVPYNIGSYALLTHLLAKWAGMEPGNLSAILCDAHIYDNQFDAVAEQIQRTPGPLPQLKCWFNEPDNFFSWDCELIGWFPQSNIKAGEVEV